jgi:hypothetical protein
LHAIFSADICAAHSCNKLLANRTKKPLKIRPIRQIRGKRKQTLRLCALASIEILPVEIIQIPIVDVMNPNSIIKYNSYE